MIKVHPSCQKTPMKDFKTCWGRRDTRWDVYPQQEPVQLIGHDWHGFWCPLPDGTWFLTCSSYSLSEARPTNEISGGVWVSEKVTENVTIQKYLKEGQV